MIHQKMDLPQLHCQQAFQWRLTQSQIFPTNIRKFTFPQVQNQREITQAF